MEVGHKSQIDIGGTHGAHPSLPALQTPRVPGVGVPAPELSDEDWRGLEGVEGEDVAER